MDNSPSAQAIPFTLHPAQITSGMIEPRMLAATPVQANGDLYYSDGGAFQRLAIGSVGQVLTVKNGVPAWQKTNIFVGAKGSRSTTQSIPDNTATAIQFTSEDFDTDDFHDNVTNNTRLTVPAGKDGYYSILGQVAIAANATGRRLVVIRKNGVTIGDSEWVANSASFAPYLQVSAVTALVATDYLELYVFQNSGGSLNTDVTSVNSSLSCARMGV